MFTAIANVFSVSPPVMKKWRRPKMPRAIWFIVRPAAKATLRWIRAVISPTTRPALPWTLIICRRARCQKCMIKTVLPLRMPPATTNTKSSINSSASLSKKKKWKRWKTKTAISFKITTVILFMPPLTNATVLWWIESIRWTMLSPKSRSAPAPAKDRSKTIRPNAWLTMLSPKPHKHWITTAMWFLRKHISATRRQNT